MTTTTAGIIFLALLILALAAVHVPLGDYMYRVYSSEKHSRAERAIYRLIGADPKSEQTWGAYARSVLAFSAVSILFLFIFQLVQGKLPLHLNDPATPMTPALAWNTAVSFVTNTNWQAYSGESTQGHLVQMAGLAVQNFVSAAVGMAVAIALVRGFARRRTGDLGNFWVDLVRGTLRILLPISIVGAIILIAGGAIQNFHLHDQIVNTLAGGEQTITGGPVASQEVIKELGTNGGGFYNANSAHPFENPNSWTNWVEIFLLAGDQLLAAAHVRPHGRAARSRATRSPRGHGSLALISVSLMMSVPAAAPRHRSVSVGAAMEGVEQRFGVANSAVFADATTLTSTGAVDSFHDSYTSLGGMITLFNMQLGEVAPGGTGSGLYGMLVLAMITVFVAGLMVGRTPEYLGKKITPREIKLAATLFPDHAADRADRHRGGDGDARPTRRHAEHRPARPVGGAVRVHLRGQQQRVGVRRHHRSTPSGTTPPSAWRWCSADSCRSCWCSHWPARWPNRASTPASIGTLPTHRPQFVGMVAGVTLILVALTFLPMLALGPLAEGIH